MESLDASCKEAKADALRDFPTLPLDLQELSKTLDIDVEKETDNIKKVSTMRP